MTFLSSERPFFEDLARQLNARAAPSASAFESLVLLVSEPFFSAEKPALRFDDEGRVTAIVSGFPFYSCALACEKAPNVELDLSGQPLLRTLTLVKCGVKAIDVSSSVALREVTITSCPKLRGVKCTEKQKSTIAGLRKFFKLAKPVTDPAKMGAIALQAFVEHYNWDDGMPRLLKAVRNPHCSLATALTVYWRASPHWVLQCANDAAIPASEREVVPLMREIERRALEGAYRHHPDIEWISGDVMRDPDPKLEKKRALPPHMVALTRVDSPARQ